MKAQTDSTKNNDGGLEPKQSMSTSQPTSDYEIPTKSRFERFVIGFLLGGMFGFFGVLLYEQHFFPALVGGLIFGFIIGSSGALFGKRVFDFFIELITRFPG